MIPEIRYDTEWAVRRADKLGKDNALTAYYQFPSREDAERFLKGVRGSNSSIVEYALVRRSMPVWEVV